MTRSDKHGLLLREARVVPTYPGDRGCGFLGSGPFLEVVTGENNESRSFIPSPDRAPLLCLREHLDI